jgi:hypothetical protein
MPAHIFCLHVDSKSCFDFQLIPRKLGVQIYEYGKDLLYGSDAGNGSALNLNRIELAHA